MYFISQLLKNILNHFRITSIIKVQKRDKLMKDLYEYLKEKRQDKLTPTFNLIIKKCLGIEIEEIFSDKKLSPVRIDTGRNKRK